MMGNAVIHVKVLKTYGNYKDTDIKGTGYIKSYLLPGSEDITP